MRPLPEFSPLDAAIRAARADPGGAAVGRLLDACDPYLLHIAQMKWPAGLQAKEGPSDLVQQTLLEAYRDFHRFAGDSQAEWLAWVRRILLNNLQNLIKHYHTEKRDVLKETTGEDDSSFADPWAKLVCQDPSPCTRLQRTERAILLDNALAALQEEYRKVIRLRHEQGLAFADIGRQLGRSEGAAEKLWKRAVKELARQLRKHQ